MRDEDDHGGPDDEDGLLGQNAGGAAPGYCACLSVAYYRPYFDVDTDEVAARLRAALFFCNEPFGATLRGKPDAYGPWWVATTLVFAVAVTSHVRGLLGAEASDVSANNHRLPLCSGLPSHACICRACSAAFTGFLRDWSIDLELRQCASAYRIDVPPLIGLSNHRLIEFH